MPTIGQSLPPVLIAKRVAEAALAKAPQGARIEVPALPGIEATYWRKGPRFLIRILAAEYRAAQQAMPRAA